MADYKLSLTAEEIEKKLSMCTLPMVEIEVVGGEYGALTDAESSALDEAFNTGLPCVIARRYATGSVDTSVAQRHEATNGTATLYFDEYECLERNKTTMKWEFLSLGGE